MHHKAQQVHINVEYAMRAIPLDVSRIIGDSWLVKAARWLLRNTKTPASLEERTNAYHTSRFNGKSLIDDLPLGLDDLEALYSAKVDVLLMGPRVHDEYMGVIDGTVQMQIGNKKAHRIFGLKVVIIPWMEGYVMVNSQEVTSTLLEIL